MLSCREQPVQFKRGNALRIKSNNIQNLPDAIQKSLIAIKRITAPTASSTLPDDKILQQQEEPQSLLDQIRQGVRLKPVPKLNQKCENCKRRRTKNKYTISANEDPLGAILLEVLNTRYMAMQQSDDEEDDAEVEEDDDDEDDAHDEETNEEG